METFGINEVSKPDSNGDKSDDSRLSNADSPGGCFKVPPLKIVLPITDGNMETRTNGKNDNHPHHYIALPYVVPSEKTPPASNQPNSPKSPQNVTPDTIAEEEQKSPQTGVLRSSYSCESNNCGTSSIVPDEQLAQTTSPVAMEVDAESSNPSLSATHSEQTENASVMVSGEEKLATTTATVTVITTAAATPISTVAAIATTAINEVSKPDSNEDKSDGSRLFNADSPGGCFKVPPLKIMLPITDDNMGTRTNGKHGNHPHHYIELPYVVPSKKTPPASNQPNSPKSPQNVTPDTIAEEEQKSPQTGVLRSSYSCESNNCGTSSIVPDEQLAQTTSPVAMEVDAESSNPSLSATCSEQTENPSIIVSGDNKLAATTAAATPISTVTAIATTTIIEVSKPDSNEDKSAGSKLSNANSPGGYFKVPSLKIVLPITDGNMGTRTNCKNGINKVSKPDSNGDKSDDSRLSNADSPGGCFKVPPLKIMLPITDDNMGTRTNGKHGNHPHHYIELPYVVSSEKTPPASNQPNSPKSPQNATPDTIAEEEQKSPQTRVLRSYNRCESSNCSTSSIVPDEQLAQTTSPAAMEVDAESSNPSLSATRSEQTENASVIVSGDNKLAITTAAATPISTVAAITTTVAENSTTATATATTTATAKQSGIAVHPRRRKLKGIRTEPQNSDSSTVNVTAVETTNPSGTTAKPGSITNCYQMYLDIRKQVDKKRKNLFSVQPKPPSGFKDYLMNRCTYILAGNFNSHVESIPTPPPTNLHEQLKKLFVKQEKERQKLRVQHIVEKEKLVLSVEQEILRVHGRAARALANQTLPFSACTILRDEEIYNILTPEQEEERDRRSKSRYNGRLFLSWLQDIDDKWEKIKESLLMRHHNEAESLYAVQKMDWGWKLKELQLCTYSSEPKIDEEHVPMVLVCDDFDLPE